MGDTEAARAQHAHHPVAAEVEAGREGRFMVLGVHVGQSTSPLAPRPQREGEALGTPARPSRRKAGQRVAVMVAGTAWAA